MEPYDRFLSRCTNTGGYKKSEDGEFLATGGPPYILLTPESCDSYKKNYFMINHLWNYPLWIY